MRVTVLEPSWDGLAHCPVNVGTLRVIRAALPEAKITLVAGKRHHGEITKISSPQEKASVECIEYSPALDADTMPGDVLKTWRKLKALPHQTLLGADLIVLTSCTACTLSSISMLGLAPRTLAFLHGNANDLFGWRSRNPLRRGLDFVSAMKRFARAGGKVLVYEEGIRDRMVAALPWLSQALFKLGHPLLQEEYAQSGRVAHVMGSPIRIGFAGNATIAKGFPEFLRLATEVTAARPGQFEFHSFSPLHAQCKHLDQSSLATKASVGLPRPEFIRQIASLDLLFAWHSADYYSNAASGILYDAINLKVPLLARTTDRLEYLASVGAPIALTFNNIEDVARRLIDRPVTPEELHRLDAGLDLAKAMNDTSTLAESLSQIILHPARTRLPEQHG
jgi:hypothetical protein